MTSAKQVQMLILLANEFAIAEGAWAQRRDQCDPVQKEIGDIAARLRRRAFCWAIAPEVMGR